jgi:hypothetical protein
MVQYNSSILPNKKSKLVTASTVRCLLVSFTLFVIGLYGIIAFTYITTTPSSLTDDDRNNFVKATMMMTMTKTDWEKEERERTLLSRDSMECLTDDNHKSNSGRSNRRECCFAWNVNLDEWRTYHPTWGAIRMEKDQYCITKFYGKKAKFFHELHNLQFGIVEENDKKKTQPTSRNCSNVLQNLQISSGMGRAITEMMDGFVTAYQQYRPYQLNRLRNTSRWMYASADTSNWAYCSTMSIHCYILPFSNCITTYGIDDKTQDLSASVPGYLGIYEYLMRFNHQTMIHIQEQINNVSNSNLLLNSHDHDRGGGRSSSTNKCTVIHVRRGDSGQPRSMHRKYVSLAEYIRVGNITPSVPVLILTDDQTTIYEATTYYPDYNWIYMDRPRVNLTYGGFEGLIPSGDEAAEFVAIYTEMHLASHCNKVVHGVSGFIRELKIYCEVIRQSMNLPSQTFYKVPGNEEVDSTEKKRCQKLGTHYCAERMIEEIYRNAAEGLKNRMRSISTL